MPPPFRVLVADDSALARRLMTAIIARHPDLVVAGEATDGEEAVRLATRLTPDVIVMDVHMPGMDGIKATREIMEHAPRPIVAVSAAYPDDVELSFKALDAGALAILPKPAGPGKPSFDRESGELARTLKLMAELKVVTRRHPRDKATRPSQVGLIPDPVRRRQGREPPPALAGRPLEIVGVAASTGGPHALAVVLAELPPDFPLPVVVVQHIAPGYHAGLADWLSSRCRLTVRLAAAGERPTPGEVLIAPGGAHMGLDRRGCICLADTPPIGGHRPSATHLFRSLAASYGARALGVVLTGMGADGAEGLVELKQAGGLVLAQDEASSVVFGMPGEAAARGAVDELLDVSRIAPAIRRAAAGSGASP